MILGLDIETYSAASINNGSAAYAAHETTGVHCAVFSLSSQRGENRIFRWTPGLEVPAGAVRHIEAGGLVLAHNVNFESNILRHLLCPLFGWPQVANDQWLDTAAIAAGLNLPVALGKLAAVLKGAAPKDEAGNELMKEHATVVLRDGQWVYPKLTPEIRERILAYCERDVVSMLDCYWRMPRSVPLEQSVLCVDRRINARGMLLDIDLVRAMRAMADERAQEISDSVWRSTGDLIGLTSPKALATWLVSKGVTLPTVTRKQKDGTFRKVPSVDRAAIATLLARKDLPGIARE